MTMNFAFFFNSILLGVGLAMDAFSVSLANGLNEPGMKKKKMCAVAGTFAFFQATMPMIGWVCVHTIVRYFGEFQKFVPWVAFVLLLYIGGKMIIESVKNKDDDGKPGVGVTALIVQGIATSIDALSVGFTIAEYKIIPALVAALIIATVTFVICAVGIIIGKKFGTKFSNSAQILGGTILVFIGFEILISSLVK